MKKIMISMILVICMICSLSIIAFAETPDVSLNLNKTTTDTENILMFTAGKTYQFKNHTSGVTYTSSNPSIITVDKTGNITANKLGSCTITRSSNGTTITYPVIVNNSNNNIPTPNSNQLSTEGNILIFTAGKTYTFNNHGEGVTYSSSNPSIITVDKTGNIAANKLGSCTITRSSNGTTITYPVIVNNEGVNEQNQTNKSLIYSSKNFHNPSIPNVSAFATDFRFINAGNYIFSANEEIKINLSFDNCNTVMVLCTQSTYTKNDIAILVNSGFLPLPMLNMEVQDIAFDSVKPMIFTTSNTGILQDNMKIDSAGSYNVYVISYNNINDLSGSITFPNRSVVNLSI